jgi:hypothetical protein
LSPQSREALQIAAVILAGLMACKKCKMKERGKFHEKIAWFNDEFPQ